MEHWLSHRRVWELHKHLWMAACHCKKWVWGSQENDHTIHSISQNTGLASVGCITSLGKQASQHTYQGSAGLSALMQRRPAPYSEWSELRLTFFCHWKQSCAASREKWNLGMYFDFKKSWPWQTLNFRHVTFLQVLPDLMELLLSSPLMEKSIDFVYMSSTLKFPTSTERKHFSYLVNLSIDTMSSCQALNEELSKSERKKKWELTYWGRDYTDNWTLTSPGLDTVKTLPAISPFANKPLSHPLSPSVHTRNG